MFYQPTWVAEAKFNNAYFPSEEITITLKVKNIFFSNLDWRLGKNVPTI
jgi:hypothetical protein